MSEYPYENKIHTDDRVSYKTVYSSDGVKMGEVEAAFSNSFYREARKRKKLGDKI